MTEPTIRFTGNPSTTTIIYSDAQGQQRAFAINYRMRVGVALAYVRHWQSGGTQTPGART